MRAVIQRVKEASVEIDGKCFSRIGLGILVLLGIEDRDSQEDIEWLVSKLVGLRIFGDDENKMNLSSRDVDGQWLVVSQFTLWGAVKKGNRPSFIRASKPDFAIPMYEAFVTRLEQVSGKQVQTGVFGADMKVSLVNDGPVTLFIDTASKE